MANITIEKVTAVDLRALQQISKQTFQETFTASNSEANMKSYLEEALSTAQLTSELNDPNAVFYFAKQGGAVVGYLKLNFGDSQTEMKYSGALEIERIYVLRDFLGKQVGQLLYDHAIEIASKRKAAYVWLGVWEANLRAIRFYEKNGFVAFDKHIFKLGDDEQTDIMMKLELHE